MVTFLNNLPSFDKDNFSNFQPDLNQYAPKKQHSYVIGTTIEQQSATDDDEYGEQVIVNQRCNLIIQYLDKQSCDDHDAEHMLTIPAAAAEKSRKRDIREVLDTNPESIGGGAKTSREEASSPCQTTSSKYTKKRRTSVQNTESIVAAAASPSSDERPSVDDTTTAATASAAAAAATEVIELIEVDQTNDNVDF